MLKTYLSIIFLIFTQAAFCGRGKHPAANKDHISRQHFDPGINIYVISKDKYFDLTNRIILWQAEVAALLHSKKLKIVTARSTADAERKISAIVSRDHCCINNLWFDSHGKYRKGYSSFMIGADEYNYKNIGNAGGSPALKVIASLCDPHTNIGIGACYGAADYNFPVLKYGRLSNMYGDSLLKGMAQIFKGSEIYGSKSWVMAKPWIFGSKKALEGYPLDRQYKDTIFLPVWETMGEWHRYSTNSDTMENINSVYLSRDGDIRIAKHSYLETKKAQRKLKRNLRKLRPSLYTL